MFIIVEGNIGSGKTTLCQQLQHTKFNKPHKILLEQVDVWLTNTGEDGKSILSHYYEDPKRYSFTFQTYVLLQRINYMLDMKSKHPDTIFICERSHLTDLHIFARNCYDMGNMNQIEWNTYIETQNCLQKLCPSIDGIIYNKADVEVCYNRINQRARKGESNISKDYLSSLENRHEEWFKLETVPILTLNGNIDVSDSERENQLNKIVDWINKMI